MKKSSILLLVLLSSLLSLNSCSSDDDNNSAPNGITIGSEAFTVGMAQILKLDEVQETTYSFTMTDISDLNNVKTISINVQFPIGESVTGEYNHPTTSNRVLLEVSAYSVESTSISSALFDGTGTATITDNGNENYSLTFDLTMDDGVRVNGSYTGVFIGNNQ